MQLSHYLFVFIALLSAASIPTVDAIKCYQCNSHANPECANLHAHPPHKVAGFYQPCNVTEAKDSEVFCRLMSYKFKFLSTRLNDLGESRVIRTCGFKRATKACYTVDNDHHSEVICQCFEDGCNSATSLTVFSLIPTLFVAYFLKSIF